MITFYVGIGYGQAFATWLVLKYKVLIPTIHFSLTNLPYEFINDMLLGASSLITAFLWHWPSSIFSALFKTRCHGLFVIRLGQMRRLAMEQMKISLG